jgi:hypothetical protein
VQSIKSGDGEHMATVRGDESELGLGLTGSDSYSGCLDAGAVSIRILNQMPVDMGFGSDKYC